MQSDLPWNISGISTEAREAARTAARREGISLGQWLSRRITQSAPPDASPEREEIAGLQSQAERTAQSIAGLEAAIEALRQELTSRPERAAGTPSGAESTALTRQLEALMVQQQSFAEQVNAKISVLAGTMTQIGEEGHPNAPTGNALTEQSFNTATSRVDGRIRALSDSFVSLSGSVDLLRRDFREAMNELDSHLSKFNERLRGIEKTLPAAGTADTSRSEAFLHTTSAERPHSITPEPLREEPPLELSETAEPVKDSFTLSEPAESDQPDAFSVTDSADNRAMAAEARLDAPWRSAEYDADEDEEDTRQNSILTVFLRLALVIAVILAAAAGTMAYRHITFAELKAAIFHKPQAVTTQSAPPPVSRHTAADIGTLTDLAKNGNSQAMLLLGIFYADGTDVPANVQTAVHWLGQASSAGEAIAQYRLGIIYEGGHGMDAAPDKAAVQFSLAAKAGNLQAMYLLASAYSTGTGVDHNAAEAAHWYQKAANYGLADAALNLAQLYEQGDGVEADPVLAYKWYSIAAAEGDNDANPRLKALTTQLSAADLTRAREAAKAFRPAVAPIASNQVPDIASVLHGGEN